MMTSTMDGRSQLFFYPNKSWCTENEGQLRMFKRQLNPYQLAQAENQIDGATAPSPDEEEKIEPRGGRLVLFRSRDMPHEVLPCKRKRYGISLFLLGPPGPGDQPDHHTPA